MRIAIISDMHGNCLALDAVLEALRHETLHRVVCLGGVVFTRVGRTLQKSCINLLPIGGD